MRQRQQWWSVLVVAVLVRLVGVTAVAAAGEQFIPLLVVREGALRSTQIPRSDGIIAYLTLLRSEEHTSGWTHRYCAEHAVYDRY